jgi:hypothetical protein
MDVINSDIICSPMASNKSYSNFVIPSIGIAKTNIMSVNRNAMRGINKTHGVKPINVMHTQAQQMQQQIKNIVLDVPDTDSKVSSVTGDDKSIVQDKDIETNINPKKNIEMEHLYTYLTGTLLLLIGYVIIYKASKKV